MVTKAEAAEAAQAEAEAAVEQTMAGLVSRAIGYAKGTAFFEEAVTSYGNGPKFGVSVQFQWDPNCDDEEWLSVARVAADRAKAFVWEQLGIDAYRNEDGILVRAGLSQLMQAMPGSTLEAASDVQVTPHSTTPSGGVGPNPPYYDSKFKNASRDETGPMYTANREWAIERYKTHPQEFKDNREAKASGDVPKNAPDFSHKEHWKSGFYDD